MTFQVLLYAMAIVAGVVSAIIAAYAYLFHKRDFWKIAEWEQMRVDQKTADGFQARVKELEDETQRLAGQVADSRATIEESEIARNFLEKQSTWKADKAALEQGLSETHEKVRKITEELVAAEQRRHTLSQEIAAYEGKLSRLREIQEEVDKLQKEKQVLDQQLALIRSEFAEMDKKVKDLRSALEALAKAIADGESKLAETIRKQHDAEEACAKAESNKRVIEQQAMNLQKECDSAKATLTNLQKMLDDIKKTRQGTVEITAQAFDGLYKPALSPNGQILGVAANHAEQERECLRKLAAHVEERQFVFSERLLYAFHTALKTSDISCLTVMAGVSGTGKSALPKLYAEAMGIHFTLLAVEPRWDSPRDLFGFFNYMENRYEPTSLARALVQFNAHETHPERKDLSDQLLMVLLDEMNLARIEYYFSEYLSKLELRREEKDNITNANSDGYRKVSMELFAGRKTENGQKPETPIRLFADSNVLFVGTMNEDETTQSLSDKVIDRANVIHFSRPLHLQNRAEEPKAEHVATSKLSADAWLSWQRVANANEEPIRTYAERLNGLNEILGHIGRPFAHRTYQAILAYIANYPHENRRERALADQIAMRVMPKLRGLDLDQHKGHLVQIAGHISGIDPAISRAFESAMNNKQGFFRWQGIDWDDENG